MESIYISILPFIHQSYLCYHILGEMIKYQWEIFYTTVNFLLDAFENHQGFNEFTELTLNTYEYIFFYPEYQLGTVILFFMLIWVTLKSQSDFRVRFRSSVYG